jgi:hypothetical protein
VAGSIRAAFIVGEDPISGADDPEALEDALKGLDFLAVSDTVPTATTALAGVVLPLCAPGESSGSYTSTERRVQAVAAPLTAPAGLTDLEMVSELAEALGVELGAADAASVRSELAEALDLPGFPSGDLPPGGVIWGGGTLYEGGVATPDGAADLSIPPPAAPGPGIDPRWTDSLDIRLSRVAEEACLPPHVVRRRRVSA